MRISIHDLKNELKNNENYEKAKLLQRFFKTGKGEYGEGDIFLGIVVPQQRKIAKNYIDLSLTDLKSLLNSRIHEERMISLFILVDKYKKADKQNKKSEKDEDVKKNIFEFYLKNTKNINNWDLVDLSAPNIVGNYLLDKEEERGILYKLAKSDNLWDKRISIISTFTFIRNKDFEDSLKISEILISDKHDLIHKAVGWMLREIGKKDMVVLEDFLGKHYKKMPRTMLRYSIEKFPEKRRKQYLSDQV
ncbi:MAG TPA: DNA alkylation repair protein [Candidatus Paceibacterota bacterium]|nr:DNA alkylation repair protein [Candidatus Paceibacterota bacterium]